jgi:hypothetical protein
MTLLDKELKALVDGLDADLKKAARPSGRLIALTIAAAGGILIAGLQIGGVFGTVYTLIAGIFLTQIVNSLSFDLKKGKAALLAVEALVKGLSMKAPPARPAEPRPPLRPVRQDRPSPPPSAGPGDVKKIRSF